LILDIGVQYACHTGITEYGKYVNINVAIDRGSWTEERRRRSLYICRVLVD
jgi:hypothetical protein